MKTVLYRPKKKKRRRKHGFLKRSRSKSGRAILSCRRRKGRYKISI